MADYRGGDIYYALARSSGLTADPDHNHWKKHNQDVRQRMKALQLGINYGMGVPSLAKGLDRHPLIASPLIESHRRVHPRFWEWRDQQVQDAMLDRTHRNRVRLAATYHHKPEQAHALQFSDAR